MPGWNSQNILHWSMWNNRRRRPSTIRENLGHLYIVSPYVSSAPNLRIHSLPELEVRAPTAGPLTDVGEVAAFVDGLIRPTGARQPTVLVINLEGRFPNASVVFDLVVRLGRA